MWFAYSSPSRRRVGLGRRLTISTFRAAGWTRTTPPPGDAEDCYRRALQLDPTLSNALTNLGNIRFRQGQVDDAEQLYLQALEVDASQPEAHYNLGFLAYERGEPSVAIPHFERALVEDPSFADAHFNLAMALEELGAADRARPTGELTSNSIRRDRGPRWLDATCVSDGLLFPRATPGIHRRR